MTAALDTVEDVTHFAGLFLMVVGVTLDLSIVSVLLRGKTLPRPRNPIYWILAIGCMADVLALLSINIGCIFPARQWVPAAYVQTTTTSRIVLFFHWSSRPLQTHTTILLALNRVTAVLSPMRYEEIWSNPWLIGIAIGCQVSFAALKGAFAVGFDVYWIHSEATGGWYNMVYERDYTKTVLAVLTATTVVETLGIIILYAIHFWKLRENRKFTLPNDSQAIKQERSLLFLALSITFLEIIFAIIFIYIWFIDQNFDQDPRLSYIAIILKYNIHFGAQPFLLIIFCRPVRQGLKQLWRIGSNETTTMVCPIEESRRRRSTIKNDSLLHHPLAARHLFMLDTYSLPSDLCFIVNVASVCLLYISFPLLTCHFVYRYLALARPDLIRTHFALSAFVAILFNVVVCVIICSGFWICERNVGDHFFDAGLLTDYGIDMHLSSAPRMIQLNYVHSQCGEWNWNSTQAMATTCSVLAATIVVNVICASRIVKQLDNAKALSPRSRLLQGQLFRTLIVQFSVPFLFCTIPFSFVVLFPMTGSSTGQAANLIGMSISIYPTIDPYLVLFNMPKFLKIILDWYLKYAAPESIRS